MLRFRPQRVKSQRPDAGSATPVTHPTLRWFVLVAIFSSIVFGVAGRNLDTPGLYYDEVIQATPATEFLRPQGEALDIPGASNLRLCGGWFPWRTQPYMGALKSQLLIPVFAIFGADAPTLRRTTLAWGCLGLALLLGWIQRLYGFGTAATVAALLALDPNLLFVLRHDWGSVSLALVCRGGGLWLLTRGGARGSAVQLGAGGFLFGLGVYNKIDFAGFALASTAALAVCAPPELRRRARERPELVAAALGGAALGALPMLVSLRGVGAAAGSLLASQSRRSDAWAEKASAWRYTLDGSYFERLFASGGRFEQLADVPATPGTIFPWLFGISLLCLAVASLHAARRGKPLRSETFAALACVGTLLLLFATPRAARIHHTLNALPLPQLVVALALSRLWKFRPRARRVGAALAALLLALNLWGQARLDLAIARDLEHSGGRGRWSDRFGHWLQEVPADARIVSLDWGFHAPLRFLRPELVASEPFWRMHWSGGGATRLDGDANTLYLVQEPEYAVFPLGAALLAAVAELPSGRVEVQQQRDRLGAPVFRTVRIAGPHRLVYRGRFEVQWR